MVDDIGITPNTHTCCAVLCCADLGNRNRERNKPLRENNNNSKNNDNRLHHTLCKSLSQSLNLSPRGLLPKKQETETRERQTRAFSDLSHYPIPTVFAKFSFPPLEEKKREKKRLHVDDQDGVRSRKLAGLSLHNNIIGLNNKNKRRRLIVDTHTHIISTSPSRPCSAASPTYLPRVVVHTPRDMSLDMQGARRRERYVQ